MEQLRGQPGLWRTPTTSYRLQKALARQPNGAHLETELNRITWNQSWKQLQLQNIERLALHGALPESSSRMACSSSSGRRSCAGEESPAISASFATFSGCIGARKNWMYANSVSSVNCSIFLMMPSLTQSAAWVRLEVEKLERRRRRRELCRVPRPTSSRRWRSDRLYDPGAFARGEPRTEVDSSATILLTKARCSSTCRLATLAVIAVTKPGPDRLTSARARLARYSYRDCIEEPHLLASVPGCRPSWPKLALV